MTLIPSNLYVNVLDVSFTPVGGSASPFIRQTRADIDGGVSNISFKGDGDLFPTMETNVSQVPSITLAGGNIKQILGVQAGQIGTLMLTIPDARNGTQPGGGGMLLTLSNAIVADKSASAPHAQFASGSTTFSSFSSDGVTNPLSMTML